jgi:hypothetical protein
MKVLNFNAVEILPSLLNKTKTQTIRLAWKGCNKPTHPGRSLFGMDGWGRCPKHGKVEGSYSRCPFVDNKEPRFKPGEIVRIEWKSRNSPKGSWFWKHDGSFFTRSEKQKPIDFLFPKILGTVKITEVFKIEMNKTRGVIATFGVCHISIIGETNTLKASGLINMEDLAKRDGFYDANSMFQYFDKNYGLEQTKTFYVYRWEWMK